MCARCMPLDASEQAAQRKPASGWKVCQSCKPWQAQCPADTLSGCCCTPDIGRYAGTRTSRSGVCTPVRWRWLGSSGSASRCVHCLTCSNSSLMASGWGRLAACASASRCVRPSDIATSLNGRRMTPRGRNYTVARWSVLGREGCALHSGRMLKQAARRAQRTLLHHLLAGANHVVFGRKHAPDTWSFAKRRGRSPLRRMLL